MFKKLLFIVFLTMVFVQPAESFGKRYDVKSGIVKFKTSGSADGTETLYFEDHGKREARYTETSVSFFGINQTTQTVNIIDGEWSYSYDPKTRKGSRVDYKKQIEQMTNGQAKDMKNFSKDVLKAMDAKKIGTEKVLNKKADVYLVENMGYKIWLYKGVPLKVEVNFMGFNFNMEAVSFEENVRIDAAMLKVPTDVEFTDVTEYVQNVNAAELNDAMGAMKNARSQVSSQDMEEAQRQMAEAQKQFAEAQKKMQEAQAQMEAEQASNTANGGNFAQETMSGAADSAGSAVQESVNDAAKTGVKKLFGGAMKSLFK